MPLRANGDCDVTKLGLKVLIKHFKESGLAPETMLRTQRSRRLPKPEKLLIFGILAKGGPMKIFTTFLQITYSKFSVDLIDGFSDKFG